MVNDERGAVLRKDVFEEPVKKYIPVRLLHRFSVIPRRGTNKTMIGSLVSPIEESASETVLQTAKRFDTRHDLCHRDPLAEILKQPSENDSKPIDANMILTSWFRARDRISVRSEA